MLDATATRSAISSCTTPQTRRYAKNNATISQARTQQASAHYFVDENEVWQSVRDTDAACTAAGAIESAHHPLRGICTNRNSIGVEMCSDIVGGKYVITAQTVTRAVELVKMLMAKYRVPLDQGSAAL